MPQDSNSSYYYSVGSVGQSKISTLVVEGNLYLTNNGQFWIYTNTDDNNVSSQLTTQQKNGTEPILLKDYINTLTKIWIPNIADNSISFPNRVSIGTNNPPPDNYHLAINGNSQFTGDVLINNKLTLNSSIDFTNSTVFDIINNNSTSFSIQSNNNDLFVIDTTASSPKITISADLHIPNNKGHYNSLDIGNGYGNDGISIDSNGNIQTDGNITIGSGFDNTGTTLNSNGSIQTKNNITTTNINLTSLNSNNMIYLDSNKDMANLLSDILTIDTNNKLSIIDKTISLNSLQSIETNHLIIGSGTNNYLTHAAVSDSGNIVLSYNSYNEIQLDFNSNTNTNLDNTNLEKILTYSNQQLKWDYLTNIINSRPVTQSFSQTTPIKITGIGTGGTDTFFSIYADKLPPTTTQGLVDIIWNTSSTTDNTNRYMLQLTNNNYNKDFSFIHCQNKNPDNTDNDIFYLDYSGNLSTSGNILPFTDSVSNLGSTSKQFQHLYLGVNGFINFDNSNFTITHTNNTLTFNATNIGSTEIDFSNITMNNVNIKSGSISIGSTEPIQGKFTSIDIDGDLAINNDKFVVTSSNGNTTIAGTLDVNSYIVGTSITDGAATLASGALSSATDIDGSGDLTMGTITMTGFSVDADGDTSIKSLNNNSGGIINAGDITGATTINASGAITGGTINVGTNATIGNSLITPKIKVGVTTTLPTNDNSETGDIIYVNNQLYIFTDSWHLFTITEAP